MKKSDLRQLSKLIPLLLLAVMFGCAANDIQLQKPVYNPVGSTKGAGGKVLLASSLEGTIPGVGERIQWILGEVRDSDGKVKGNVTSQIAPSALVRDALKLELLKAGYAVDMDKSVSSGIKNGLLLSASSLTLDEIRSLIRVEAECKVSFTVEIWRNGAKTNSLSFESRFADIAVKDREKLHQDVLQKAFEAAFSRAVPAIVEQLGK